MKALERQLRFELERFKVIAHSIESLFIGGGTPSTVTPEAYQPLFALLEPYLAEDVEITAEANPNSATEDWLRGMHDLGVNRISFGVQSFDADKLRALGRAHNPKQAIAAVERAAHIGFAHLSIDLIYNHYRDTQALLKSDIDTALRLPIDHISAYELTIESGTAFAKRPQVRKEDVDLARFVADSLHEAGMQQYEISNFGRYRCRHNLGYWQRKAYIGAGAGAVGFLDERRFYPLRDIDAYINDPLAHKTETLDASARLSETLFLGFRSEVGVALEALPETMRRKAAILCEEGKLIETQGRLYNPDFFLADAWALFLLE